MAPEPTPHEAHRSIAERSALLQEVLDELAIPAEQRSTTGVRVTPEWEYRDRNREHVGYRASNAVRIRLEDASIAGRLIQQATQRAQVRVEGPSWRVALDNPARAEACRLAAADAKRKAQAYVEALGGRLGPLVTASEPGLRIEHRIELQPAAAAMAGPPEPEITIEAGELDVAAALDVTFAIEQG